jgi:hypothetical protein
LWLSTAGAGEAASLAASATGSDVATEGAGAGTEGSEAATEGAGAGTEGFEAAAWRR